MAGPLDMKIIIIGAGMGGLGCALSLARKGFKHIEVYETAPNLGFVGAGIQMAPNMVRILDRLGCWRGSRLEKEATNVKETSTREGSTNKELGHVDMPDIAEKYGYPHCTGHRSSLAGGMYEACKKEPAITFHFGTSVVGMSSWGPAKPRVTVRPVGGTDQETKDVEADVILAADGIKSVVRRQMLARYGAEPEEEDTGQACYRIMLTRAQMEAIGEPELLELMDSDMVVRWIGEKRHIIAYGVSGKSIYNLSTTQPDVNFAAAPSSTYTTRGSKEAMLKVFEDFCPLVHKMLNMVPSSEVCEWKMRQHKKLPTWCDGPVALLGDACHPTLPHLSQGAAMAIEDGAVIAEVLSRLPPGKVDPVQVGRCLKVYELLRKDRTSELVDLAAMAVRVLHLGEGKAKEERDRQLAEARAKGETSVVDKWASPEVQKMAYSHDCVQHAIENYDSLLAKLQ
ncbi:uncharacterized protein PgNI_06722 [Pyricularia grisea]|uniref:FAD-binding domain-containing protein n=1 Tax=Pyricularia grisea TaxID=148305 RepID=A0A6P8AZV9_PYRGI|nr:uncharacterized protein PgNI_06722 [Pyricularia grisea]TLD08190.1 hypothetical protein PgNI_06722 [Pyricularia grisea]